MVDMETSVTLIELIVGLGGTAGAIIGAWVHMRISVTALKTELKFLQKELEEEKEGNKKNYENLVGKIDTIFSKIGEVRELILNKK